jgi:hypothetical protein
MNIFKKEIQIQVNMVIYNYLNYLYDKRYQILDIIIFTLSLFICLHYYLFIILNLYYSK